MSPRQVRRKLYSAVIVITVGSTDAHRLDFLKAAHLLDDDLQGLNTCVHIIVGIGKAAGLDGRRSFDVASGVNDSKHGVRSS